MAVGNGLNIKFEYRDYIPWAIRVANMGF